MICFQISCLRHLPTQLTPCVCVRNDPGNVLAGDFSPGVLYAGLESQIRLDDSTGKSRLLKEVVVVR